MRSAMRQLCSLYGPDNVLTLADILIADVRNALMWCLGKVSFT